MKLWAVGLGFVVGLLALPIGILVLAWSGLLPTNATANPPRWEVTLATRALHTSLATRARRLHNPFPAGDSVTLLAGMKLFRENCAGCHGGPHADSAWGAQNFYPRVPQFWRRKNGTALSPEQAYTAIHDGIRYSGMGAWKGMLREQQIWHVANFISRMQSLPPEVRRAWTGR